MANFHTHITVSTLLGVGYGAVGHVSYGVPIPTAVLAGGLCGVAGMLPDVDSDFGIPLRESMAFLAAVTPMLLLDRFREIGWTHESIVLAAALIYLTIRFGVAELIRRLTVHRGMWHSIPAAGIVGLVAYHLCQCPDTQIRLFKTGAVIAGYLSHLVLDELYATDLRNVRVKKSFGTALKMWGKHPFANLTTYAKLCALAAITVLGPPTLLERPPTYAPIEYGVQHTAQEIPVPRPPAYPDIYQPPPYPR